MDLLPGTDVLPLLGFRLLKRPYREGPVIDMMECGVVCGKQDTESSETYPNKMDPPHFVWNTGA